MDFFQLPLEIAFDDVKALTESFQKIFQEANQETFLRLFFKIRIITFDTNEVEETALYNFLIMLTDPMQKCPSEHKIMANFIWDFSFMPFTLDPAMRHYQLVGTLPVKHKRTVLWPFFTIQFFITP